MRNLEGLQLTEELRNRLTEWRPSEDVGIWLTECRWRNLVHMRGLGSGWGQGYRLGSVTCSWVGSTWLVTFLRALASASALIPHDCPSSGTYCTNLTILESLFDLSCFSLSIFIFQNIGPFSIGRSSPPPPPSQSLNPGLAHCCWVTVTIQPPINHLHVEITSLSAWGL